MVVMAFLQYKAWSIPGKPLKRKKTPEETREQKKKYKKDRERKFIDSWKQDPGFITTLNKMLWSATGASKPMDQKSCPSWKDVKISKLAQLKITRFVNSTWK